LPQKYNFLRAEIAIFKAKTAFPKPIRCISSTKISIPLATEYLLPHLIYNVYRED
jgi:hypothetical protein